MFLHRLFFTRLRTRALASFGALLLSGCPIQGSVLSPRLDVAPGSAVGFGIQIKEEQPFAVQPDFPNLYGKLVMTTRVAKSIIAGPEAVSFSRRTANFFGISKANAIAITTKVTAGGLQLPATIPFSYSYDEGIREWRSSLVTVSESPWTLLGPGNNFVINLEYLASDKTDSNVAEEMGRYLATIGTMSSGAWVLSPASAAAVGEAGKFLDDRIETTLKQKVSSGFQTQVTPSQGDKKSFVLVVSVAGVPLVEIAFEVRLTTSLLKATLRENPTSAATAIPNFDSPPEAQQTIRITGKAGASSLTELLPTESSYSTLLTAVDVPTFEQSCQNFLAMLGSQKYNLSEYDRYLVLLEVLRDRTSFFRKLELYNSRCLGGPNGGGTAKLQAMGLSTAFAGNAIKVTPQDVTRIVTFMKTPADTNLGEAVGGLLLDEVLLIDNMDSDSRQWESAVLSRKDAVARLASHPIEHGGCYQNPVEAVGGKLGMQFSFDQRNAIKHAILEAYAQRGADIGDGIGIIKLRRAKRGDPSWNCTAVR